MTLLGMALGFAVATLCASLPPRDFSYGYYLILLGVGVPSAGIFGYILWLADEPARYGRLERITQRFAIPAILLLLFVFVFSGFRRDVTLSMTLPALGMLMGFVCGLVMFAVAAWLGVMHFVGYLATSARRGSKSGVDTAEGGVWDRELDRP